MAHELARQLLAGPDYEVILPPDYGCEFCDDGDQSQDRVGSVQVVPNAVDGHGLAVMLSW